MRKKYYLEFLIIHSIVVLLFSISEIFAEIVKNMDHESANYVSLTQCEKTALENHSSIRLAKEEMELSVLKEQESLRAVFPSLSLKGEQTKGKGEGLKTPDFIEKNYGVQFTQPLFQGGKIQNTYKQARENRFSARTKLTKAEHEVIYRSREAYWNMVKAKRTLNIHQQALSDLKKEKEMADQLLQKDAITPQIYMTINSQYNQASYQLESAKAEMEFRLWQWTSALGLKSPPSYQPNPQTKIFVREEISLEECVSFAKLNHPDLLIQRSVMQASLHGYKAAQSYRWPNIDLNGFYGRSGAAFEGENLELKDDWQLGVRLGFNFGYSSTQLSEFKQKTSPKLGQSSRTEIETLSASIGIADSLKNRSEEKEAVLSYHQAETQLEKAEMEILNGVREAYAGWRKALAQLKIAENDLALALTEFSVTEIKSSHREVPVSERAVMRNKLAQSEVALAEAQASYAVTVAALNHSIGSANQFEAGSGN